MQMFPLTQVREQKPLEENNNLALFIDQIMVKTIPQLQANEAAGVGVDTRVPKLLKKKQLQLPYPSALSMYI